MHIQNPFKNLSSYTSAVRGLKQSATDWYHNQIKKISDSSFRANPSLEKLEKRNTEVSMIVPGHLYLYSYDPKYKATLPVYDKFPLLFPFKLVDNGFLGLNLHYLSGQNRVALMSSLINIFVMYPRRADRLSWEFLSNTSFFPGAQDCIHRYLWSHVRSPFLEIQRDDWLIASQLPVEKFVYNNKQ